MNLSIERVRQYQAKAWADPVGWMRAALGVTLWHAQEKVLRAVRDRKFVAVRTGHAVGKSYLAAAIAAWYSESRCPSNVIPTSVTWLNIAQVFWPTFRLMHAAAPVNLGGRVLDTQWDRADGWGVFSISTDYPENFGGYRTGQDVCVIVDEASALPWKIHEAIMGLAVSDYSRVIYLGNPLVPSGPFFEVFRKQAEHWFTVKISSFDSPNVSEGREVIRGLATQAWIDERRADWGEGSPQWQARVLGEFPETSAHGLIRLAWLTASADRAASLHDWHRPEKVRIKLGVDVADAGDDANVMLARAGDVVLEAEEHRECSLMETVGKIVQFAEHLGILPEDVRVDCIGVGAGVVSRLHEIGFGCQGVNFAESPRVNKEMANLRAECYWSMREALNPSGNESVLAIPHRMTRLHRELANVDWLVNSRGKTQIEPKDDVKKKLGHSPDWADALALTYAADEEIFVC